MNGWDVFTWVSAAALAVSALLIFGFFLRDVGGILRRERRSMEESADREEKIR